MTHSTPPPLTADGRQQHYLKQLADYQQAIKTLLEQQPNAVESLTASLYEKIQRAFPGHPLPIAMDSVLFEECLWITAESGVRTFVPASGSARRLSDLFKKKPWGGEHFATPNYFYRYFSKATYREKDATSITGMRTINRTTGSTPAFESFVEELIRRPDRYYQYRLDQFWQAPLTPDNSRTRSQWLADLLGKALLAEACLRVEDRTLDEPCKTLIEQIMVKPSSAARALLSAGQRPAAFAVSLKGRNSEPDIPLARVFVLAQKTPVVDIDATTDVGTVALYTPDQGLEQFPSLQALDRFMHARLINRDSGKALLTNVAWQDLARAQRYQNTQPLFNYRVLHDNVLQNQAESLLKLQQQDIEHGWRLLPWHEVDELMVNDLFNRLADISPLLDIRNLMEERSRRFIEASFPPWYPKASVADQQALGRLILNELALNQTLATLLEKADIPSLKVFSRQELVKQLGIDHPDLAIDPDKVIVEITTTLNPNTLSGGVGVDNVGGPHTQSTGPTHTLTLSLTALALKNSNPWNFSFYRLFSGEETSMSASVADKSGRTVNLDENYLTSLIQNLDISKGYDELLKKKFIDDSSPIRKTWIEANRASLAASGLAARLDMTSFLEDREHRGFQWVKAITDADRPDNRQTVGGHKIVASALLIANTPNTRNGYALNDVLMISVEQRQAVPNVVLYAPGAPSGQVFKEFVDMDSMQNFLKQQWVSSPDWKVYFMQRLSTPGQAALTESRQSRTRLLSELVRHAASRIGNPFETIHALAITGSLHDALYDQQVYTLRRNADHESTSNAEVEEQSRWNKITFGIDLMLDLISFVPVTAALRVANSITKTFLLLQQFKTSKSAARALWSITGARGRIILAPRPAPIPALALTSVDLSGLEVSVNPLGLVQIRGNLYQSKVSPQQYALLHGKYYLCDVAQQQRFIYPPGATGRSLRYPLALDETAENWAPQPRPRLPGGMDSIEKSAFQTTYQDYELPDADRAALPGINLAEPGDLNLSLLRLRMPLNITTGVLHLFAIQSRLRRHAKDYFKIFPTPNRPLVLPPRDLLPEPLFNHLFTQSNGLLLAERHTATLARRFLIENIAALKRQGLKSLYLEIFHTDIHQVHLDSFNLAPTLPLAPSLQTRLELLDAIYNPTGQHSYKQLVETAHAAGIKVKALDSAASALLDAEDLSPPGTVPTLADDLDRISMFNFHAHKKIASDQLTEGPHRWMALVGTLHCNTVQSIPGLADLNRALSIRLGGVAPSLPMRIQRDPGFLADFIPGPTHFRIQCDLLICLPGMADPGDIAKRVYAAGMFSIRISVSGHVSMHYMNGQAHRIDVPVLLDGTRPYVNHFEFGAVSNRRFHDLAALCDALVDELHMIQV